MNAIEIKGLCKRRGSFELRDIDLSLPSGCILGLVGENGAGKTTLINTLLGLLRKDGGSVSLLGKDPAQAGPDIMNELGVVPDAFSVPGILKAPQVGRIFADAYSRWDQERFEELLDMLEVPSDKPFMKMSSGMKMKLGIAAALSHDARLIIFDEATNALDPVMRDRVNGLLLDLARDEERSVLISSHIVSDLEKICDYIAFLHRGRIALFREKDELSEEYCIASVDEALLAELPAEDVLHVQRSLYGIEAVVRRAALPEGIPLKAISIEELFVMMSKEMDER